VSAKFIYHSLKIKPIQGTGTTQQQLTVPMFRNTLLVVPAQEVMSSFTLKADSLFALRRKNQQEIRHLTTLRDTLLPKLMSGEIDVNEVEI
jgi:type I restriction enzyme S subunit